MGLRSWLTSLVETTADAGPVQATPVVEAMPGLEYDDPDINLPGTQAAGNWRRLTQSASDLAPLKQDQMQQLALYLSDRNPLARGILDLIVSFIVGEGFTATSKDEDVQKIIDRFWEDAQNDLDTRAEDLTRELSIYGEQLLLAFVNESSGRVALVSVDPRQIRSVASHPTATDRAYAVGLAPEVSVSSAHRWVKIIEEDDDPRSDTFGRLVGAKDGETFTTGGQTVSFYQPDQVEGDATKLVGCFFWAINKPRSALRGRSDLLAVADNVDMLDQFLFDEGQRMSFQRVFAWVCKITGADQAALTRRAAESAAPKPGGVLYTNESEEWTVLAPSLNTQDSQNYADLQLSAIATAVGVPKTWLNGLMDVNRATAQSMDAPGLKRMTRRQKLVRRMLERLVRFALDQAEIAGALSPAPDGRHPFTLSVPEMSSRDMEVAGRSLMSTAQAMGMASAAGWIDTQTAQEAIALMMNQLGVQVDVGEIQQRLEQQQADDQAAQTDGTIPDYFGLGKHAGPERLATAMAGHANGTGSHGTNGTASAGSTPGDPIVPVVSPAAKDVAAIISQVSKALVDLGNAGVVDGEFAQEVVAKLFHSLGVDVDVAAMQQRLADAKAEAQAAEAPVPSTGAVSSPALPPVDDLINLDQMALEAIREMGEDILVARGVNMVEDYDRWDPLETGLWAFVEAFDAALHPRAAGGRFGPKPDQPAPSDQAAPGSAPADAEIAGKVKELIAQLAARDAAKPKTPRKPPEHPALKQNILHDAISSLQPDDDVTLTLTNGIEVSGKVTLVQGGSAVMQMADGKFTILHDHLKGVNKVATPNWDTPAPEPATPRAPKAPNEPKAPVDRSASAKKAAATRASNKAAAASKQSSATTEALRIAEEAVARAAERLGFSPHPFDGGGVAVLAPPVAVLDEAAKKGGSSGGAHAHGPSSGHAGMSSARVLRGPGGKFAGSKPGTAAAGEPKKPVISPLLPAHHKKMMMDKYKADMQAWKAGHGGGGGASAVTAAVQPKTKAEALKAHPPALSGPIPGSSKKTSAADSGLTSAQQRTKLANATITRRNREYAALEPHLTPAQKHSMDFYEGDDYKPFNAYLRAGRSGRTAYDTHAFHLDTAISRHQLPEDTVLYRAVDGPMVKKLKPGAVIEHKAYVSTTVDERVTGGFAAANGATMVIRAPRGTPALPMPGKFGEEEYLLPRGFRMRIDEVRAGTLPGWRGAVTGTTVFASLVPSG